jgi:DNA-binding transcriptional LysR family regulator
MKIEHLKFFLSVADCLNFTQAAKENHIAQTAISRYISNMEAELGVKLFFRNNRYVELTPEGVQFYLDMTVVLQDYEQAIKNIQSLKQGFRGRVNIGMGIYESDFVSLLLKEFHTKHQDFKVTLGEFSYNQLSEMIAKGDLDLAFTNSFLAGEIMNGNMRNVKIYDLFHTDACAIVNSKHDLAQKKCVTKNDINNKSVLLYNDHNKVSIARLAELDIHVCDMIQFNSFPVLISMVRANYGIGFVPDFVKSDLPLDVVMIPQTIFRPGRFFMLASCLHNNPASEYFMNIVEVFLKMWKRSSSPNMPYSEK